jgi:hypothetical protein
VSYPGTVESVNFRGERTECQSNCAEFIGVRIKFVGHSSQTRSQELVQATATARRNIRKAISTWWHRFNSCDEPATRLRERESDDFDDWAFDASDR